jgi:hypothetical protein
MAVDMLLNPSVRKQSTIQFHIQLGWPLQIRLQGPTIPLYIQHRTTKLSFQIFPRQVKWEVKSLRYPVSN